MREGRALFSRFTKAHSIEYTGMIHRERSFCSLNDPSIRIPTIRISISALISCYRTISVTCTERIEDHARIFPIAVRSHTDRLRCRYSDTHIIICNLPIAQSTRGQRTEQRALVERGNEENNSELRAPRDHVILHLPLLCSIALHQDEDTLRGIRSELKAITWRSSCGKA